MARLGPMELVLLFGIALVIFGPSKLPELGKTLGKTINEFKSSLNVTGEEMNDSVKDNTNESKES